MQIMSRVIIYSFFLLILTACSTDLKEERPLPNIVLIIGDDQGYPYFGFMGADYVKTPNMDSLASSGTLFINGYVPDNHCRPALQSLMTGTLPKDYNKSVDSLLKTELSEKQMLNDDSIRIFSRDFRHHAMRHFETLPRILKRQGYSSFQGGKWWEFNYQNGGFTDGMTTGWTEKERLEGSSWFVKFMGGDGLALSRKTMNPVYDFIERSKDEPFFIWYAPELPHYPFNAPDRFYDLYKEKEMTESAKRYYANCTWFDEGVGDLISFLKEKNEFENTLFVYVNDNGWEQNPDQEFRHDSLRWHNGGDKGKLSIYDQSFRTPLIFSWQNRINSGITKKDLAESVDVPATILDYIGVEIPEDYHGISLKPIIEGKSSQLREIVIGNSNKIRSEEDYMGKDIEGYWIRTDKWFFRWIKSDNETALYDMSVDPNNDHDLSSQHPEIISEFKQKIIDWM